MLKFHLAQRLHVHILSRAPLRAGDVFQPGRSQAETGLTIGKGPDDPGPSSNFLHQPLQRIVRPDFAPMAVGEAVIAEGLPDLLFDRISRFVQPHGAQFGNHSLGFPGRRDPKTAASGLCQAPPNCSKMQNQGGVTDTN